MPISPGRMEDAASPWVGRTGGWDACRSFRRRLRGGTEGWRVECARRALPLTGGSPRSSRCTTRSRAVVPARHRAERL